VIWRPFTDSRSEPFFLQGGGEFLALNGTKWSAFAQDDWKVSQRLVLNLGVRWDPYLPFTEEKGRIVCFLPGVQSMQYQSAPIGMAFGGSHHDPGCPENGSNTNAGNIAPRVGFA
jgi:TonB dependent receptor